MKTPPWKGWSVIFFLACEACAFAAVVAAAVVVGVGVALTCAGITGTPVKELKSCSSSELLLGYGAIHGSTVPAGLFGSRDAGGNLLDP